MLSNWLESNLCWEWFLWSVALKGPHCQGTNYASVDQLAVEFKSSRRTWSKQSVGRITSWLVFITKNKLLAFKWGNASYDRSVALVQLSHRLNSHGLFKPSGKEYIHAVFKGVLLSCLISVPASIVCEKLSSSLETNPSDSQLCVSSCSFCSQLSAKECVCPLWV